MEKSSLFKGFLLGITLTLLAHAAAPTIEWTTEGGAGADPFGGQINPPSASTGETYMIRARGRDSDGNLAAVSIDRNGVPFAYAGGGDGWVYITNNPSSGAATYTAWATDANNQRSEDITLTVNHTSTPPHADTPSISVGNNGTPSVQINVTANFTGGSEPVTDFHIETSFDGSNWQIASWSGNNHSYTDTDPGTRTVYYKCAVSDDHGGTWSFSGTASADYTVTVPPQPVSSSITASQTAGSWPLSPTISWNSANAGSVSVSGPGLSSSAASGQQVVENLAPGYHTYTITANGADGPAVHSITVTVNPLAPGLTYPRRKYVGAYYDAWFDTGYPWTGAWGGSGVVPTGLPPGVSYVSNQALGAHHAQKLTQLGVDFVAIDNTNNTIWGEAHPNPTYQGDPIFDNSKAVISGFGNTGLKGVIMLSIGNSRGGPGADAPMEQLLTENYSQASPPTMTYANIPSNAGDLFKAKVGRVYNEIANDPSRYFYYEGKPLLLLYTTASGIIHDRYGQNITPNGKLEGAYLNIPIPAVNNALLTDIFTVRWVGAMVSKSGNPAYVAAPDETIAKNGHWSWEDAFPQSWARQPTGWPNDVFPETVTVTAFSRAYGSNAEAGRLGGNTFREQWNRVWEVDPVFSMVHTWNEFSYSGDEPSAEKSHSIESNSIYGSSYEALLGSYTSFLRSWRLDVGLYDPGQSVFRLFNRRSDFDDRTTTSFGFETKVGMNRGAPVEAIAGDFNHDGLFELGLRNVNDGSVALRFSPRFTVSASGDSHAEVVVNLDAGSNWHAFTGDFNADGYCDIGLYDTIGKVFKFYLSNGNYGFSYSHQFYWNAGSNIQVTCADINTDGKCDLVIRDPGTGIITFGLNNGDNLASAPSRQYTLTWLSGASFQLFAGDFSSDGAAEIGLRDSTNGRFYFRRNSKSASGSSWNFATATTFDSAAGASLLPVVGDFH